MLQAALLSVAIFVITLFLMIKQPKGINLGLAAGIGAAASLLLGTVSVDDAMMAFGSIWGRGTRLRWDCDSLRDAGCDGLLQMGRVEGG